MSFFEELRRRNVFRVGAAYAVAAWVVLQLLDVVGEILELPAWGGKLILLALVSVAVRHYFNVRHLGVFADVEAQVPYAR